MQSTQKPENHTPEAVSTTADLTDLNPPPIATNGSQNMSAVMEGLAQVQDGLRKMVLNGATTPRPRSLSNGLCVILLEIPDHKIEVMEGEEPGTSAFFVDNQSVMEGWKE